MTNPLQAKDNQWRDRRQNASVPVFDPGMSPLGTDEEAGGARPLAESTEDRPRAPMPANPPSSNSGGLRLPPRFWYAAAVALIALLAVVGWISFG